MALSPRVTLDRSVLAPLAEEPWPETYEIREPLYFSDLLCLGYPPGRPQAGVWGDRGGEGVPGTPAAGGPGSHRPPFCGEQPTGPHTVAGPRAGRDTPQGHTGLLSGPAPTSGLPGPGGWGGRGRCPQSPGRSGSPPRGAPGFPAEAHWPISPRARPSPGAGPLVAVPVLEPEAEPSRDIILVGSSKPAPGSCRPRRGEAPGADPSLRVPPGPAPDSRASGIFTQDSETGRGRRPPTPRPGPQPPGPSAVFTRERQEAEGTGVRPPFAGVGAYEVQVDRRDIEGERGPGEGGRAARVSFLCPFASSRFPCISLYVF